MLWPLSDSADWCLLFTYDDSHDTSPCTPLSSVEVRPKGTLFLMPPCTAYHKNKHLLANAELVAVAGKISISLIQCQGDEHAKEHRGR